MQSVHNLTMTKTKQMQVNPPPPEEIAPVEHHDYMLRVNKRNGSALNNITRDYYLLSTAKHVIHDTFLHEFPVDVPPTCVYAFIRR